MKKTSKKEGIMLNIREACSRDISNISNVLMLSWKSAYRGIIADNYLDKIRSDHWAAYLTNGFHDDSLYAMVIEDGQQIIGAAIISGTDVPGQACLVSFYLVPDKIGQGTGHVFYEAIEKELMNQNYTSCTLDVLQNNNRAIQFYKRHNFIDTGRSVNVLLGDKEYCCTNFYKLL